MTTQPQKPLFYSYAVEALQKADIDALTILEHITDGFVVLDKACRCVYVNQQAEQMLAGTTREELFEKPLWEVFPQAKDTIFEQKCHEALQTQESVRFERFCDPQEKWYELQIYPAGEGLTLYVHDITQRKKTEQDFREHEEFVRKLLQNFPNGSVNVFDKDLRYLFAEGKGLEQVGLSSQQLVGKTLQQVFSQEDVDYVIPYYHKAFEGEAVTFELWVAGQCYSINAAPLQDNNGSIYAIIAVALNITERKELERRKDEFLSMASHELKTPLSNIWILTHLLRKQLTEQGLQDSERNLTLLGTQAKQLMKLLTDVLEVSQLEAGYLLYTEEPFDVNALVHEIVSTLQQVSTEHAIVITGTADRLMIGDRDRLGQVLTNLLTNAIKYSVGTDKIDVLIASTPEALTISVRDYGVGIPYEEQPRIFERFYRAQNPAQASAPGFGMGLYISREIVKRHGGQITVESEEGKGSTFTVVLPVKK